MIRSSANIWTMGLGIIAAACLSCHRQPENKPGRTNFGRVEIQQISISAWVEPQAKLGQPIRLVITLQNDRDEEVDMCAYGRMSDWGLRVYDSSGAELPNGAWDSRNGMPLPVRERGSVRIESDITRNFSIVSPGEYTLDLTCATEAYLNDDGNQHIVLEVKGLRCRVIEP